MTVDRTNEHVRGFYCMGYAGLRIAAMLLLWGGGLCWLEAASQNQGHPRSPVAVGRQAADFTTYDTHDNVVALQTYHGRPVVLNFWATWCAPCRQELPVLQAAYEAYHDKGLVILAISQDATGKKEAIHSFMANLGITFPPLLDPEGSVAAHYNVFLLPSTIFINPAGTITAMHVGPMTRAQIEKHLAAILPQQG